MMKISILGSTGSIGTQTLEVVDEQRDIEVVAMSCGSNLKLLEKQIRKYHPKLVSVWKEEDAKSLRTSIADLDVDVLYGMDGLIAVATYEEAETVVTAIVGMLGVQPTIAAIKAHKKIALANN